MLLVNQAGSLNWDNSGAYNDTINNQFKTHNKRKEITVPGYFIRAGGLWELYSIQNKKAQYIMQ